jgi:hypothetical protein
VTLITGVALFTWVALTGVALFPGVTLLRIVRNGFCT